MLQHFMVVGGVHSIHQVFIDMRKPAFAIYGLLVERSQIQRHHTFRSRIVRYIEQGGA